MSDPVTIMRLMPRLVALLACLLATLPALGDQRGGSFTPVSPDVQIEAPLIQSTPAVASNGDGHLAVWADLRINSGRGGIIGTLVSRNGDLLTPYGMAFEVSEASQSAPLVASNGRTYLVAWTSSLRNTRVRGALVSPEGEILRSGLGLVSDGHTISLTSRGDDYLLLSRSASGSVRATRIDSEGRVLGYSWPGQAIAAVPQEDGYLLLRTSGTRLYATKMTSGGILRSHHLLGGYMRRTAISAASDGDSVIATWGTADGIGVRLLRNGEIERELLTIPGTTHARVTWTGSCFVVAAVRGSEGEWVVEGYRFSADGTPLNATPELISVTSQYPKDVAIGGGGQSAVVVWEDDRLPGSASGSRIAASLARGCSDGYSDPVVLSHSSIPQLSPVIAPASDGYIAVWAEFADTIFDPGYRVATTLHSVWLDHDGRPRPGSNRIIDSVARTLGSFAVATDPLGAAVVWDAEGVVHVARVPRDSSLPLAEREIANLPASELALAWGGTHYLVTAAGRVEDSLERAVEGIRFRSDLEILDPAPRDLGRGIRTSELRWNGSAFVLIATHTVPECNFLCMAWPTGTTLRTISADAVVLRERELDPDQAGDVAAACNRDACAVVARRPGSTNPGLELMLVDGLDGQLTRIEAALDNVPLQPEVVWDGSRWQIFWVTRKEPYLFEVRQATIVDGELVVHPDPVSRYFEAPAGWNGPEPVAASRGDRRTILLHGEIRPESGYVKRLGTRTIGTPGPRRGVRPPAAGDTSTAPGVRHETDQ